MPVICDSIYDTLWFWIFKFAYPSGFVCTSDFWFMTFASFTPTTIPACPFVLLLIRFLVLTFASFWTIRLPVVFILNVSDYLATDLCLNKDNVLCLIPCLHLVPSPSITRVFSKRNHTDQGLTIYFPGRLLKANYIPN